MASQEWSWLLSDGFDLHARFAAKPFDDGEFLVGKFHCLVVNDAPRFLGIRLRHGAVERLDQRHTNDLCLREFAVSGP